ncbi:MULTISPECIES: glycosyltransferase family 2 protein [Flavobacteriaceae]|uniref:Glycosyltransferase family 2 protein n=2 Tax=Flavobacteriaceae TaxID=49546 RepID=A0A4Y8ATP2_9FLAO|nr:MULTISPECIES: glycosyltransferase family 2 protein [Flavobacteriaceae]TEW75244.1 glycosyltransferase family 2 protein [Gramella jeungdoensis]GGK60485.1 beta-glycosyltransferase [Lutibacter litoralis]
MKKVTVFTPTYNRAFCLHQIYNSLVNQTNTDFCWLVIDDGSTDTTKELVASWINEGKIAIQYVFQENQGMHGAHNTAYELIKTELNVCIDSDDYMTNNAVELILNKWKSVSNKEKIAGIVGLDVFKNGEIVGKQFPKQLVFSSLSNIYNKYNVTGDKKLVLRTDVVKKYPKYPIFNGERFVPLGTLYLMIDQEYQLACLNQALCVVEYLPGGSSNTIFKQYKLNPKGFRYARTLELKHVHDFRTKIKKTLHFISSTLFIGDYQFFKNNPKKVLTFLCLPLGFLFHLYIVFKSKK